MGMTWSVFRVFSGIVEEGGARKWRVAERRQIVFLIYGNKPGSLSVYYTSLLLVPGFCSALSVVCPCSTTGHPQLVLRGSQ